MFSQEYTIWGWKSPTVGDFKGKVEILNTCISSVGHLQLSVRKLQRPFPPNV